MDVATLSRLARLSDLRVGTAERALRAAQGRLAAAEAEAVASRGRATRMAETVAERRAEVRTAFVGQGHIRAEVSDVLSNLLGLDRAIEVAEREAGRAEATRDAARPPVAEARRALAQRRMQASARARLVEDAARIERRRVESRLDDEAAEQWQAGRLAPGAAP